MPKYFFLFVLLFLLLPACSDESTSPEGGDTDDAIANDGDSQAGEVEQTEGEDLEGEDETLPPTDGDEEWEEQACEIDDGCCGFCERDADRAFCADKSADYAALCHCADGFGFRSDCAVICQQQGKIAVGCEDEGDWPNQHSGACLCEEPADEDGDEENGENECPEQWEGPPPPDCMRYDCTLEPHPDCWVCEIIPDEDQNGLSCDCPYDACFCEEGDCVRAPADGDEEAELDHGDYILSPEIACNPTGDACSLSVSQSGIHASYRKDYSFPDSMYNEYTDPPINGGRFQIAAISAVTGEVTDVLINGQPAEEMLVEPLLEWFHVWPKQAVAGEPIWVNFHSRNPDWDTATEGSIVVQTTEGDAVNGQFPVLQTMTPLTYVTTADNYTKFLIHIENWNDEATRIERIFVNGKEVFQSGVACVASAEIPANRSALIEVPLCETTTPGAAWTVVVEYENERTATGAGRVIPEFFPIETWPNSSDCPFPTANEENFNKHKDAGFDTHYIYWGGGGDREGCNHYNTQNIVNNIAPGRDDFHALIGDNFLNQADPANAISDTSRVAAFMTGDESDGELYNDEGVPNAWNKARKARELWDYYPEVPVYNGAKTNGHVGAFAGMADIQGIDLYVAACAPHITNWGTHPPLRAAYDYLRNTRNNHMPLPTWQYTQGLSPVWNKTTLIGNQTIHVQPDRQEILLQAMSVIAAGGKGLMWFQSNMSESEYRPDRWGAIAESNRYFQAVRAYLREGDITGQAFGNNETIVDMVRARDALIVPVINLKVETAVTDIACGAALVTEALVPHWILGNNFSTIHVRVPKDFGVMEIFEVANRQALDIPYNVTVDGREIRLENIPLNNDTPVRLFVFAADESVRQSVEANLQ